MYFWYVELFSVYYYNYSRFAALWILSRTTRPPGWASTRKVKPKPIWISLSKRQVSGNGISWTICKSAHRHRQITMPAPHHSFLTGRIPFLLPIQQRESTEGISYTHSHFNLAFWPCSPHCKCRLLVVLHCFTSTRRILLTLWFCCNSNGFVNEVILRQPG